MLINHRIAQLGVVGQKRPVVWQSYLPPNLQQDNIVKVSLSADGDHKLNDVVDEHSVTDDSISVTLNTGNHKLIDPTKLGYAETDTISVSMAVGGHKLVNLIKNGYAEDNTASVAISVGDHHLRSWGIRAEVLDEDNFGMVLAIGDHKLYEENV